MTELEKLKMDYDYINQKDIVKRYLQNKLTPEETVEFEEYILDKPELLERLELDSALYSVMPKVVGSVFRSEKQKVEVTTGNAIGWLSWWRPFYSHTVAIAASITLVMVLANGPQPESLYGSAVSPSIVYLETYRSEQGRFNVAFAKNEKAKLVVLMAPRNVKGPFSINAIEQLGGSSTIIREHINANDAGELVFLLDKNTLKPSAYQIVLNDQLGTTFYTYDVDVR